MSDAPVPDSVFTIGHSSHPVERFVELLRGHGIAAVADVRRFPGSRKHPQFDADALARSLGEAGIAYAPFVELGGRRTARVDSPNAAWRNAAFRGYADYMETPEYAAAFARLASFACAQPTAFMCAEGPWWQCHRSLIADDFKARGARVLHVMPDGRLAEHPYTEPARVVDGRVTYRGLV